MSLLGDPAEIVAGGIHPRALLRHLLGAIPEWHDRAACKGEPISTFFPEIGGNYAEASLICSDCDAQPECLAEGMQPENINFGMFGGATPAERKAMRKIPRPGQAQ